MMAHINDLLTENWVRRCNFWKINLFFKR